MPWPWKDSPSILFVSIWDASTSSLPLSAVRKLLETTTRYPATSRIAG